jgi:hypothetical protein
MYEAISSNDAVVQTRMAPHPIGLMLFIYSAILNRALHADR